MPGVIYVCQERFQGSSEGKCIFSVDYKNILYVLFQNDHNSFLPRFIKFHTSNVESAGKIILTPLRECNFTPICGILDLSAAGHFK